MYSKNINLMIAKGIIHDKTINLLGVDAFIFDKRISLYSLNRIADIKKGWQGEYYFPLLINLTDIEKETGFIKASVSTFIDRRLYEEI